MSSLTDPIDDRHGRGVRINARLHVEQVSSAASRRELLRALGIRGRRQYPVQARAKGESLVVRMDAHYSPFENQSKGALRSYLERAEARAPDQTRMVYVNGLGRPENVLQNAPLEMWLDRWSIWVNPSEPDVNAYTAIHVISEELGRRFGIAEDEIYVVRHHDRDGAGKWHLHFVVPAREGMQLDRAVMREIGAVMVRELVLERAIERALDPARQRPSESGWDLPPTDAQLSVLRGAGRVDPRMTRGEASLVIEQIIGERSWYGEGRGR
jgi:hypothetical protein